jgi:hypothetical protein
VKLVSEHWITTLKVRVIAGTVAEYSSELIVKVKECDPRSVGRTIAAAFTDIVRKSVERLMEAAPGVKLAEKLQITAVYV